MPMLLSKIRCDGCGRAPNLVEWFRGELSSEGYPDWRHPGIAFKRAGLPMNYGSKAQVARLFYALFGRTLPDELSYLCPQCQARVERELPALAEHDEAIENRGEQTMMWDQPPYLGEPFS